MRTLRPQVCRLAIRLFQIIRGRSKYVGLGAPDVAAPVTVPVDGVIQKLDGMNWLWPMAPAQDPFMSAAAMWPSSMMRSAFSNSLRK